MKYHLGILYGVLATFLLLNIGVFFLFASFLSEKNIVTEKDTGGQKEEGTGPMWENVKNTDAFHRITMTGTVENGITIEQQNKKSFRNPLNITNDTTTGVSLFIEHTNPDNHQGQIRLDGSHPEIEFVETDQKSPLGKWELRGQSGDFGINSRKFDNSGFEKYFYLNGPLGEGGQLVMNAKTDSLTRNIFLIENILQSGVAQPGIAWSARYGRIDGSEEQFVSSRLASQTGEGGRRAKFFIQVADTDKVLQDRITVDTNGYIGIGYLSPKEKLDINGAIKVSTTLSECTLDTQGTIKYDAGKFLGCDGTTWKDL